jgi:penicillin amidase
MRMMQMDNYSMRAHDVLPSLLKYLDVAKLNDEQKQALDTIKNWNLHFAANSEAASIFNNWWVNFYGDVWDEFDNRGMKMNYPSYDRTEKLLIAEPNSKWFDIAKTPAKETCADIVNKAFIDVVNGLVKDRGKQGKSWQWGNVKQTHINHMASLAGFGTGQFFTGGTGSVINALRDGTGPSWRMVVQMGPEVKGFGVFPGGESGNPGSYYYQDMFETWRDGKLNELLFLVSPNEKSDRIKSTLTLSSK